jgi:hypothetical protein
MRQPSITAVGIISQEIETETDLFANSSTPTAIKPAELDCSNKTTNTSDPFMLSINTPAGAFKAGSMLNQHWNETLEKWASNGVREETVDANGT